MNKWIVAYVNENGDLYTEQFKSREEAMAYLDSEEDFMENNNAIAIEAKGGVGEVYDRT